MIALIAGLSVLAGLIQAVTGFGAAMVLMAVLPFFYSITAAPAIASAVCFAANLMLFWQFRKYVEWKLILLPGLFYVVFALLSVQVVGNLNHDAVTVAFGCFCIALSLWFLFLSKKRQFKATPVSAVICSTFSGICNGLFAIGGPLMGLYYVSVTDKRETYIASLQTIFSVNGITILLMRIAKGYFTADLVLPTLAGIAGIFIGRIIGLRIGDRLDGDRFRKVVYAFVGVSGVATIVGVLL